MDFGQENLIACVESGEGSTASIWKSMNPVFKTAEGNVGIGVQVPADRLQVAGGNIRIGEVTPYQVIAPRGGWGDTRYGRLLYFSGGPYLAWPDSDQSDEMWMARYNVSGADQSELRVNIGDNVNNDDAFVIGTHNWAAQGVWTPWMTVRNSGRVGIGTSNPQATLDVNGTVKIGPGCSTCCSAANAGSIRYNATTKKLETCDGVSWNAIATVASTGSKCRVTRANKPQCPNSIGFSWQRNSGNGAWTEYLWWCCGASSPAGGALPSCISMDSGMTTEFPCD